MLPHTHRTLHGGKKEKARIFFLLTTAFLTTALVTHGQQDVGFVVNVEGIWFLNNSPRQLSPGSPLQAGVIRADKPGAGDFIEIANLSGRIIRRLNCFRDDCSKPITLYTAEGDVPSPWFKTLMETLNKDPKRYKAATIRTKGELLEAVVKVAGSQADLSSVLANAGRDTYLLRFEARSGGHVVGPVRVDWDPNRLAVVTVKGLAPGLYDVRQLDEHGKRRERGTEASVLFASPEKFDSVFCEFRRAVLLTGGWHAREDSKRQVLRVALTKLEADVR